MNLDQLFYLNIRDGVKLFCPLHSSRDCKITQILTNFASRKGLLTSGLHDSEFEFKL